MFVFLVVASIACSYWLGTLVRSPDDLTLRQAPETVRVTAAVEERVVTSSLSVQGNVSGAPTREIRFEGSSGGARQVVTSVAKAQGNPVAFGDLLATVSGVPVFLLPEDVPLYRDLRQGDTGPDVSAFQTLLLRLGYLRGAATGTMDARTVTAAVLWYKGQKQNLPEREGKPYIAVDHFAFGAGEGSVRVGPAVGQRLEPGKPLFVLSAGQQAVTSRFTVPEADSVKVGTAVTVRGSGGASFAGNIASIGPFQSNEASKEQRAGHDVRVELSAQDAAALKEASTVSVTVSGQGKRGPAVPLSAIRQGSEGTFVTREAEQGAAGSSPSARDVAVKVLAQEGGWASIDASPELPVGTRVIVR
ncbi:efflux RND transporter periplasmic adaptor subunit [Sinomonas humi]|uniref:Peptidoglycan binding-like domain-containing protein n=1 Tax=Sinomonas humi TaxID=1338436 RepID=A0A0B2AK64_9MICC|nr:hypothetical protein [Sinomonas humi]KHL02225.1 hypothetical protein LK10_13140 [Sinomonas humi]